MEYLNGYRNYRPHSEVKNASIHDCRYQRLIEVLCRLRKNARLSQLQLANKLGFSQPDISKIELCERRIDLLETFDWIAATTKVNTPQAIAELLEAIYRTSGENAEGLSQQGKPKGRSKPVRKNSTAGQK